MTELFQDRTTAYDGSGSPSTGSATITVQYSCSPVGGGIVRLYARTSGDDVNYNLVWEANESAIKRFAANGLQYYFTWTPVASGATASLSTG